MYNPEIGDGRGFLFAQMRGADERLMDLGTKGSGQTPWSRSGDGRLTLKGAVREILATEMLEALGDVVGGLPPISYSAARSGDIRHSRADNSRLLQRFKLGETTPMSVGLARLLGR